MVKDTFKTALCANITISDNTESSRFSAVTFDAMMYVTERLMETGCPLIIEGNFVPYGIKKTDEVSYIRILIEKYSYQSLAFKFFGDTQVLFKRFNERVILPERGQANKMFKQLSYDEFDLFCRNLDGFDAGENIIQVDTTEFKKVDFASHIEVARRFLMNGAWKFR